MSTFLEVLDQRQSSSLEAWAVKDSVSSEEPHRALGTLASCVGMRGPSSQHSKAFMSVLYSAYVGWKSCRTKDSCFRRIFSETRIPKILQKASSAACKAILKRIGKQKWQKLWLNEAMEGWRTLLTMTLNNVAPQKKKLNGHLTPGQLDTSCSCPRGKDSLWTQQMATTSSGHGVWSGLWR